MSEEQIVTETVEVIEEPRLPTLDEAIAAAATQVEKQEPEALVAEPSQESQEQVLEKKPDIAAKDKEPIDSAIQPPTFWPADKKEAFKTLPADIQKQIVDSEKERTAFANQKAMEAAELRRKLEPIEQALSVYKDSLAKDNLNEAEAVQHLLALRESIKADPKNTIAWLANQTGVDVSQLPSVPEVEGAVLQLGNRLQMLEQQVAQQRQVVEQEKQSQLSTMVGSQIDAILNQKNEKGEAAFEFKNEVAQEMVTQFNVLRQAAGNLSPEQLLQHLPRLVKESYDRAVLFTPEVRARVEQKTKATREAEERAKVLSAQRASSTARSGQASSSKLSGKPSLDDSLKAAWAQVSN